MASHRRIQTSLLVLAAAAVVAPGYAASAEIKVGYVDMGKAFDNYDRTKQSEAALERKGQQKEAELQSRLEEIKKMRQGLEVLNDQAREAKSRDLERKADELRRFGNNTKEDLLKERDRVAVEIIKEIQQVVKDYGNAHGYTLIVDSRSVLFGQDTQDLTDAVLAQLNQRAGGAAGKPAAEGAKPSSVR